MTKILHIVASPKGVASLSNKFGQAVVLKLQEKFADATVKTVELVNSPVSLVDEHWLTWNYGDKGTMSIEGRKIMEENQVYSDDLLTADYVVISTPMYNFSIPAALKAWIDQISLPGKTFKMEQGNYIGLINNVKKVLLVVTNSGNIETLAGYGLDHVRPYMKSVTNFLGMTDMESFAFSDRMQELNDPMEAKMLQTISAL
jgi:FMN-dependent NADH-azoreductase